MSNKAFAQANIQAYIQVLSVGAAESSPTCLVITDRDRYMLNVGEGTQRLAMEHKVRLTRLDHIFLTALTPEALGGLPGMLLTMADCGKKAITIHGPPGIRTLLRATSHFMRREELKIIVREYAEAGLAVQGSMLAMHALPLFSMGTSATSWGEKVADKEHTTNEHLQHGNVQSAKRPRVVVCQGLSPTVAPGASIRSKGSLIAMAWVGQTASVLGKFDVRRAKELGIPTGPLFGRLKAGSAVTLPDGRVIQAEEVVAPSVAGILFGVIHIPEREGEGADGIKNGWLPTGVLPPPRLWLETALGCATTEGKPIQEAKMRSLTCMIHYTSAALVRTLEYQTWMKSFGSGTTHLLAALPRGTHQSPYQASRLNNLKLHLLDACIFPRAAVPASVPKPEIRTGSGRKGDGGQKEGNGEQEGVPAVWGRNLLKYQLLPESRKGWDETGIGGEVTEEEGKIRADARERDVKRVCPGRGEKEMEGGRRGNGEGGRRKKEGREEDIEQKVVGGEGEGDGKGEEEVEVVFLGTGSAIPSKYRNVSGVYLRIGGAAQREGPWPEGGRGHPSEERAEEAGRGRVKGMLLDVGEGSLGQLASLYEGSTLWEVLVSLSAIWISHPHADHHLGLMKVLAARRQAAADLGLLGGKPPPMLIMAPRPILAWLREHRSWDATVEWGEAVEGDRGGGEGLMKENYLVDMERMSPFAYQHLERELGLLNLTNVGVHHCPFAFGVVLDGRAGWRLVYSGDTRPCRQLEQAGRGATVLIHEATFGNEKAAEAVERKHSTVGEALDVARRMEAKTVILTHFSQRYPKFPVLPPDYELQVCVAFDLMTLRFKDVGRAAALLPALQKLFPVEEEASDEQILMSQIEGK